MPQTNRIYTLSSTSGTKDLKSMLFSGNGIGSFNRISAFVYKELKPTPIKLSYYLYAEDFINNAVIIPTTNYITTSSNSSLYFGGRCPIYNSVTNNPSGTCSATFLNIQTPTLDYPSAPSNIYTDISNYLTIDNGLIISWSTPSNPINLEISNILNSMVSECIVKTTTKIGVNPYYGMTFNMIVSSQSGKVFFDLTQF